jgi:pyruvate/2-oxoglutarate/acetoin dehydrogenase E1 component/TPP-dependent pyruvate/acetoin dehydrogenase alpha subunit
MGKGTTKELDINKIDFESFRQTMLHDYYLASYSREASLLGRKEVLTGKAKFGIFGDGKELAQIAIAKVFKNGDFRSGYYRDQTFMFAAGMSTCQEFFAQLYATPDVSLEPSSAGRQMNGHYGTRWIDEHGELKALTESKNSSSDISPTAGQMVRALGLAFASKMYRKNADKLQNATQSNNGNEVAFVTIGDASTSEGLFWETINAAGVMQVPLAVFVYDDGYGISVPKKFQTTKSSISKILDGFSYDEQLGGVDIYDLKGWNYEEMVRVMGPAIQRIRDHHIPAVFHIQEITQPQGHSTSGSHERYKSKERLEWEKEFDCLKKMREYLIDNGFANEEELLKVEAEAKEFTISCKNEAWKNFLTPIKEEINSFTSLATQVVYETGPNAQSIAAIITALQNIKEPIRKDILRACKQIINLCGSSTYKGQLQNFYNSFKQDGRDKYGSELHSTTKYSLQNVQHIAPVYSSEEANLNGYEILNKFFDHKLATDPRIFAFGEDVGQIGDVNQGFAGLQAKHGGWRVFDTGIREATILGQGMGMALRGLRPITEIQYLDYLLYALQPLSDDVATLTWRTKGGQRCPLIVRTRGHRLEGVWHSGSPMGMMINSLRGINICVPRGMVQAAGMYNTLLKGDEPGIVVECLNGYRLKEKTPDNINDFTIQLGVPEIIKSGDDITVVSYGSTLRIIEEAMDLYLNAAGVSVELIDVQTLLPFDTTQVILNSIKKTSRVIFIDEDVPSGATAYMFQQVIEQQGAYKWLDATPRTLSAQAHRPAYGTDGDYFSKPNAEDIADAILEVVAE